MRFELLNLPLYAVESLPRILADLLGRKGGAPAADTTPAPDDGEREARERPARPRRAPAGIAPSDSVRYTVHRWDEDSHPGRVEIGILSGESPAAAGAGRTLTVYPDTARRLAALLDSRGLRRLPGETPAARLARLDRSGELLDFLEAASGEHPPDSEPGDLLRVLWEAIQPAGG